MEYEVFGFQFEERERDRAQYGVYRKRLLYIIINLEYELSMITSNNLYLLTNTMLYFKKSNPSMIL